METKAKIKEKTIVEAKVNVEAKIRVKANMAVKTVALRVEASPLIPLSVCQSVCLFVWQNNLWARGALMLKPKAVAPLQELELVLNKI